MNLPPWRRDIGCFDDDRYLYYKDRKKDMIVRGGFNIYPAEVESVLYEPPSVQQCAIIGKPHKKLGEDLLAYVTTKKDKTVSVEELSRVCAFSQFSGEDRQGEIAHRMT